MKRDKIVNNLTERLCSNAKSSVPIVDVFCLQAKLLLGRYNLYGNSLEVQVKYIERKNIGAFINNNAASKFYSNIFLSSKSLNKIDIYRHKCPP